MATSLPHKYKQSLLNNKIDSKRSNKLASADLEKLSPVGKSPKSARPAAKSRLVIEEANDLMKSLAEPVNLINSYWAREMEVELESPIHIRINQSPVSLQGALMEAFVGIAQASSNLAIAQGRDFAKIARELARTCQPFLAPADGVAGNSLPHIGELLNEFTNALSQEAAEEAVDAIQRNLNSRIEHLRKIIRVEVDSIGSQIDASSPNEAFISDMIDRTEDAIAHWSTLAERITDSLELMRPVRKAA